MCERQRSGRILIVRCWDDQALRRLFIYLGGNALEETGHSLLKTKS